MKHFPTAVPCRLRGVQKKSRAFLAALLMMSAQGIQAAPPKDAPGPFFEESFPFYQSPLDLRTGDKRGPGTANFAVRGIVLPLAGGICVAFDQDLLRFAGLWKTPAGQPFISLKTMAQISYADPHRKAGADHPKPAGPILLASTLHPGVATSLDALFSDPRPPGLPGENGRGPLPAGTARFEGIEVVAGNAVLHYQCGGATVKESFEARSEAGRTLVIRHFEVGAHAQPLFFGIGAAGTAPWTLGTVDGKSAGTASLPDGQAVEIQSDAPAFLLSESRGELVAQLAPSTMPQRVSLQIAFPASAPTPAAATSSPAPGTDKVSVPTVQAPLSPTVPAARGEINKVPVTTVAVPGDKVSVPTVTVTVTKVSVPTVTATKVSVPTVTAAPGTAGWTHKVPVTAGLGSVEKNGLAFDRIELPQANPWKRRIRPADLAFPSAGQAAVLTYDGDVWLVEGLEDPALAKVTWKRFASGLNEPLAMVTAPGGILQVATKNGVVRLHDRDKDGVADWYENFSNLLRQSQSTRSFALDMDLGPDGSTFVTLGGIALGGAGTESGGAVSKIAPDGRSAQVFSTRAREPYVTVHPQSGLVTGTDQQGNFIPSSLCYLIRAGDNFGFGQDPPPTLTEPLVWIPHTEDNSSASQLWLTGEGMGVLEGKLLHLSYGTGRLFLISADLEAPKAQGAVIPLGFETNLPLLHARRHPDGNSVFLCGFQIYDSRTSTNWGLGRLRAGSTPMTTPIEALSCTDGVVLKFAAPLKASTINAEHVMAAVWNYKRSSKYGSGRYKTDGSEGSEPIGIGQVLLSADRQSVFVHLPGLKPVMQLEIRHQFALEGAAGEPAESAVFFTVHEPRTMDLAKAGFAGVDLSRSVVQVRERREEPASVEIGKTLSTSLGCVACHSIDGTREGKTGPSWKGLFGSDVTFTDGSIESANEFYLRDSILDPQKKIVAGYLPGMASYRGVLSESQIASVIMYIRTLK